MSMIDDEMLEVFVMESREHLETLEADLLTLGDEPGDSDIINRIFRSVHSVKGTSGFFGLDNISNLAHRMETLMAQVREGETELNKLMLDALVAGTDKLRDMVDDPAGSAEVDIQPELEALSPFITGEAGSPPPPSVKEEEPEPEPEPEAPASAATHTRPHIKLELPAQLTQFRLDPAQFKEAYELNQRVYFLRLHTKRDIKDKNRTPLDCFNEIASLGEFFDSYTDFSTVTGLGDAINADLQFCFLFSAPMEPDLVAGAFDIETKQITEIKQKVIEQIAHHDCIIESPDDAGDTGAAQTTQTSPSAAKAEAAPEPAAVTAPPVKAAAKETTPAVTKPATKHVKAVPANATKAPMGGTKPATGGPTKKVVVEETVRVSVSILDDLMTLAGEMVLGRNQLIRLAGADDNTSNKMQGVLQNINVVTTDLQEKVMQTRLQPIGTILGKFNRIVRDLGRKLSKDIELEINGKDVELDRSILEGLSDPLTHLIRNCADHAIEPPEEREEVGKKRTGLVKISARHAGGQVHVEIADDGRGINGDILRVKAVEKGLLSQAEADEMTDRQAQGIIFMPGFSSAEQVSDVSGRGVGMDVVKTNIENLGGSVELDSRLGEGTRIVMKLPLTLAIVPAMIVDSGSHRFAVPQVNLEEVVNLDGSQKIEFVRGSPVMRLRHELLPLVSLGELLEIPGHVPAAEAAKPTKALPGEVVDISDTPAAGITPASETETMGAAGGAPLDASGTQTSAPAKPKHSFVMVVKSDENRFGLIVDELLNIEEIVVKPLSTFMQELPCYSGATILGDGKVAIILDTTGLANMANLRFADNTQTAQLTDGQELGNTGESQALLLFKNSERERFAINLAMVARIEKIKASDIEKIGQHEHLKYGGGSIRLIRLHDFMPITAPDADPEYLHIIIPNLVAQPMGIVATEVLDAIQSSVQLDAESIMGEGVLGSAVIQEELTLFVDVYNIFERANPDQYKILNASNNLRAKRILLAEDTSFFRTIICNYLKENFDVVDVAVHGKEAWEMMQETEYDILLSDIEMPHMNGFELLELVKNSEEHKHIPVVALTSLGADRQIKKGIEAGFDAYETKLNKEKLCQTLEMIAQGKRPSKDTQLLQLEETSK